MKTRINLLKSIALLTAIFITSAVKSQEANLAPIVSFTTTDDIYDDKKIETSVYPNPSYGEVSLIYDSKLISEVVLIPSNGKNVSVIQADYSNYIDLNNLSAGYYEVRFMNGSTLVESKRLVVY